VEDLLRRVGEVSSLDLSFELWVPENLTMGSQPIDQRDAFAIVRNRIREISEDFVPVGFDGLPGGRLYRFERWSDAEPDNEPTSLGGSLGLLQKSVEFCDTTQGVISVLAGLFLSGFFCLMPFNTLGADEPWFFWVGSGLLALVTSVLLAWTVFPPPPKKRKEKSVHGTSNDDGA
jgi:hypothetical protein